MLSLESQVYSVTVQDITLLPMTSHYLHYSQGPIPDASWMVWKPFEWRHQNFHESLCTEGLSRQQKDLRSDQSKRCSWFHFQKLPQLSEHWRMKLRQHGPNADNETHKTQQNARLMQPNIPLGTTSCEYTIIKNRMLSQILKQNPELEIWDIKC